MADPIYGNPVVVHALEIDGEVYPPVLQACITCTYAKPSSVYSYDEALVCDIRKLYVDEYDWCNFYELNECSLPDEVEDYINNHPECIESKEDGSELEGEDLEIYGGY